jgi:hypothetical protein
LSCAVLSSVYSSLRAITAISGLFLAAPIGLSMGAYVFGFWLPLIALELSVLLAIIPTLVFNMLRKDARSASLKTPFSSISARRSSSCCCRTPNA